jgi:hypothetical protein
VYAAVADAEVDAITVDVSVLSIALQVYALGADSVVRPVNASRALSIRLSIGPAHTQCSDMQTTPAAYKYQ